MDQFNVNYLAVPKKFCENVNGGFNKETFLLSFFSGAEHDVYALTPAHAKRLALWLGAQIDAYEKQFATIDANLPKPIQSPFQAGEKK